MKWLPASVLAHAVGLLLVRAPERTAVDAVEISFAVMPVPVPVPVPVPEPDARVAVAGPAPDTPAEVRSSARREDAPAHPRPEPARPRSEPAPELPSPRPEPRPFRPLDRSALLSALEPSAPPRTPRGTTSAGFVDSPAPAAREGLDRIEQELRERGRAGRPEAAGVVTYFSDARRGMAAAWAPRTVRLPGRMKAMVQSMQAVNRRAIEMMEGRSERAQRAHEDGRVTPEEWRDALREAAQEARRTTSVIVAVVHDGSGAIIDLRIVRSSGQRAFDAEILSAARETLAHEAAPPMPADPMTGAPAGRVARYRFDVMVGSTPPIPPVVGVTFDESTGMFRVFYPGEMHWRLAVVFLGAERGTEVTTRYDD